MRLRLSTRTIAVTAFSMLLFAASAGAFVNLPTNGSRVDSDPAAGINPNKDAGEVDAVAGSLVGGNPAVPWATFEHEATGAPLQIFVRAFKAGNWATEGTGTVGGASSASPTFTGSLNFNQARSGEAPSIDFAGAGRTVPWVTWYEDKTSPFNHKEIFASRFDSVSGHWVFAGQGRPASGGPPSLNIRTNKSAEDPEVAGGTTILGGAPGPWITWEEQGPAKDQIFVVKPVKIPGVTCPGGTKPAGGNAVGGFCWQQVGVERSPLTGGPEPSLNVDPTRVGIEPDIAFTGPGDNVPWVVWYEKGKGKFGVKNERVFAAKAVATAASGTIDGGFAWEAVGAHTSGAQVLDTSAGGAGPCLHNLVAENRCALNKSFRANAEDPRVAAGTMTTGQPTVPWVVWSEEFQKSERIFAARLVNGTHFKLANGGRPLSVRGKNATVPDITFSRNTPFVTWHQRVGKRQKLFVGHFRNAANPTFVLNTPHGIARSPAGLRLGSPSPISSDCTANPFNGDGASCQGGTSGKVFFLFNDGAGGHRKIFAQSQP